MSAASRFTPMTAELLARKGEARPFNLLSTGEASIVRRDVVQEFDASAHAFPLRKAADAKGSSTHPEKPSEINGAPTPAPHANPLFGAGNFSAGKLSAGRRHSVSVHVTDGEFERLALIAVKKRVNRQQLLRLAIDHYLEKLAHEYRADCRCISASGSCCGGEAG
jgi:hypothetical protein